MPHLVATFIYLSQNYSYYIRGDRSHLTQCFLQFLLLLLLSCIIMINSLPEEVVYLDLKSSLILLYGIVLCKPYI